MCKVESDFSSIPLSQFKLKNRHWWNSGKKYHRIRFVIKVNFGPADLSFELWYEGVKLSKDNVIKVEWQPAPPPDPQLSPVESDFPVNNLSATANRGTVHTRKSVQDLGNKISYGSTEEYQGYMNGWEGKTGIKMNVSPAPQNGSRVW